MKHLAPSVAFLAALTLTGCSAAYWEDRAHDTADIFDITLTSGAMIGVNVGPLGTGLGFAGDIAGLRGGELGELNTDDKGITDMGMIATTGAGAWRNTTAGRKGLPRHRKGAYMAGPIPFGLPYQDPSPESFTQCGVTIAPLFGLHIGFNPGELADFATGWFGVDLYSDDLASHPERTPAGNTFDESTPSFKSK